MQMENSMETDVNLQLEFDWSVDLDNLIIIDETPPFDIETEHFIEIEISDMLKTTEVEFDFKEDVILQEVLEYISTTYQGHYSTEKTSAFQEILRSGFGEGFCLGNVIKYAKRYGKKDGNNRNDLLKIVHYAIMALYLNEVERK